MSESTRSSKDRPIINKVAAGLLGLSVVSGIGAHEAPQIHNPAAAEQAHKTPANLETIARQAETDLRHLEWGKGPKQPDNGVAATYIAPNKYITVFVFNAATKFKDSDKSLPKPEEVGSFGAYVYSPGTYTEEPDVVPEYSVEFSAVNTFGNTEKNPFDAQIYYSGDSRPNNIMDQPNSYWLDVNGDKIHVQKGNSAIKELTSETAANNALVSIENISSTIVASAAKNQNLPSVIPLVEVPGI
jgi:hypothetical protein